MEAMSPFDALKDFISDHGCMVNKWSHECDGIPSIDHAMIIIRKLDPVIVRLILFIHPDGNIHVEDLKSVVPIGPLASTDSVMFRDHLGNPECLERFGVFLDDL